MKTITKSSYSSSFLVIPEIMTSKKSYVDGVNMLFIGVLGLSLGYVLAVTTYSFTFIYQGLQLVSFFFIFYALYSLIKIDLKLSYFTFIVFVYLLWQVLILVRGDFTDLTYFDFKQILFDLNYGGFVLFVPIIAFLPFRLIILKKLFDIAAVSGILFLGLSFFNLKILINPDLLDLDSLGMIETYAKYFVFPIGILALNFDLLDKRYKVLVIVTMLSILFFAIFRARRGLIFIQLTVITISLVLHFYKSKNKSVIFGILILFSLFSVTFFSSKSNLLNLSIFKNIEKRGFENTRNYVEACFIKDMTTIDWIVGKGFNSGYHCPGIDDSIFKDGVRTVIETDYLQLIMVGGILNLILLFLCIVPALYLGFFKSSNYLVKSLALWIFIWLISLYPANVYSLNLYHIAMWICVGFCYSKSIRELSQAEISFYFLKEFDPNKIKFRNEKA